MSKNTNLRKITNYLTADNNTLSSNVSQTITGSLTVTGNLTAQQFIVSSSVTYLTESFASGSHKFGDSSDDIHTFTGSLVVSGSANPLRVGSNLLFVSSSGNVGIGTISPSDFIDATSGVAIIAASGRSGLSLGSTQGTADEPLGRLSFTNTNSTNAGGKRLAYISGIRGTTNNSAYLEFGTANDGLGAQRMVITQSGNVGIGTTSPSSQLHIIGTSGNAFTDGLRIGRNVNPTTQFCVINQTGGEMNITTVDVSGNLTPQISFYRSTNGSSSTHSMTIDKNGNLGIGTSSPAAPLHIVGNQFIAKSGGGGTYKQTVVGQTTAAASGVAKTVAYIGHTNSIRIYVWATQSASSGMTAIKDITTTYGSSAGGNAISSGTMGNVSGINIAYDNSGYVLTISVTYSGTAPTINYVIEGINNGNDIYTI